MPRKCSTCHEDLEEGIKFCGSCGLKVEEIEEVNQDVVFCSLCGEKTQVDTKFCPKCGHGLSKGMGTKGSSPKPVTRKKEKTPSIKRNKPIKMGVALVVLVAVAAGVIGFRSKPSEMNKVTYIKGDALHYTNLNNLKSFELTPDLTDEVTDYKYSGHQNLESYLLSSKDNRYLFYPEFKEESITYYWKDLTSDSKDTLPTLVDKGIYYTPLLNQDGSRLFYLQKKRTD